MAKKRTTKVSKAQIAVTPRSRVNMTMLGTSGQTVIDVSRKSRYATYYEMYRQHPTLRAGIEKIAKVSVANGYRFVPFVPTVDPEESGVEALRTFFRKSNGSQLLRLTYKDLLIYGEAFWLIIMNGKGTPDKAIRLHPMYMDENVQDGLLTSWRYGPIYADAQVLEYPAFQVVQFKFDDPDNDIRGLSLLSSLELTVAGDIFSMRFNEKYFENAAHTGVMFNMKNSTADEVERNREWLEQNYVGTENAHRPVLLEGDIDVQKSISTRQEMQFIELRNFNRQEILSVLDIDPTKVGVNGDSNRSTSKEADNTFRQENIAPLQLIVEEEVNNHLILELFGFDDIAFRQNDSSRRDLLEAMKLYTEAEKMGVLSVNLIKQELGLPSIKGGDVHFIQTSAGAIPVEWLDDVAMRLIPPTASSGAMIPPMPADTSPQGDNTVGQGTGGEDQG